MDSKLIFAIITITLALVFYTIGVFGERKAGSLEKRHVLIFWLGLVCDTIGTLTMGAIARSSTQVASPIHGITGFIAIVLMLFHAGWATWVLYKGDTNMKHSFHKFSIVVWAVWLVPYFIGMFIGMQ
ncbi:HsmA family protein [Niameybacter massiliensis]|uniref:HsmA family protein n=1 Tax=Niameybacter massiliensis TaxID=1658108 RepID=UPI0006B42520|nr:HsmA family protein [Niameybacter massiliensis]